MSLIAVMSCLGESWATAVLYQTSFESPDYVAGSTLIGQQSWASAFGDTVPQVVTGNASDGAQAVRVQSGDYDPSFPVGVYRRPAFLFDALGAGMPIVRVGVDARLDGPQTFPAGIDGDLISNNLSVIVGTQNGDCGYQLLESSNGHIYAGGCGIPIYSLGVVASLGTYHRLEIELDFLARTVGYRVDDVGIGEVAFLPQMTSAIFSRFSLQVIGSDPSAGFNAADYTSYFDNLSVTASVPEPGTLALTFMAIAALTVAGRRRSRP
jgi:hypothetical protein